MWRKTGVALVVAGLTTAATQVGAPAANAQFPGSNGKIVFGQHSADFSDSDIWTINPNGSGAQDLTPDPSSFDFQPQFSPDSTKIIFTRIPLTGPDGVYVMNADGTGTPAFVPNTAGGRQATWSPDGTKLLFMTPVGDEFDLAVVNMNGTGTPTLLTHTAPAFGNFNPRYSPEGDSVVFTSNRDGNTSCGGFFGCLSIYTMRADGSQVRKLTADSLDSFAPDWSPDGNKILFTNHFHEPNSDILVINANGSHLRQLTTAAADEVNARWSPDGQQIVLAVFPGHLPQELFTMNADGSGQTELTHSGTAATSPDWGRG